MSYRLAAVLFAGVLMLAVLLMPLGWTRDRPDAVRPKRARHLAILIVVSVAAMLLYAAAAYLDEPPRSDLQIIDVEF